MLETIGYDAATAASFAPWDAADAFVGRVLRVDRGVLTVLTATGPHRVTIGGALLGLVAHDPAKMPCVGDWVVVRSWPDRRETVEHVLPRRTALVPLYGDAAHTPVLAANVDLVAVVLDRKTAPDATETRRLLDLAAASGATPLVVLLGSGASTEAAMAAVARGVEVLTVDPAGGAGLARLGNLVDHRRTLALLGASARVTAPLVRALVGADVLGARRTRRGLTLLPGGGVVLDLRLPAEPSLGGRTGSTGSTGRPGSTGSGGVR